MMPKCPLCLDTFWVCESHPAMPWDGPNACGCGGAGMPCPGDAEERPRLRAGFTPVVDVEDRGGPNDDALAARFEISIDGVRRSSSRQRRGSWPSIRVPGR